MSGVLLSETQKIDWLRLAMSENVGPHNFRMLLNKYGSASAALVAIADMAAQGGLKRRLRIYPLESAHADMERAAQYGAQFVAPGEPGYPALLRQIYGAPPLLCIKGDIRIADRQMIAIVGARNASAIGRRFARVLAAEIGVHDFVIVSGLARGIDTAAHEAALEHGTCAILAGGIDIIYPPENDGLHGKIAEQGLLISEMTPGTIPRAEHFPRRNRIISGLARAVIVVEAALRSGTLITARLASEQGRDVFAVPGSPLDPRSEGCNRLIREGATLLTKTNDVLEALHEQRLPFGENFLEPEEHTISAPYDIDESDREHILRLLSPSAIGLDDLIKESGLPTSAVLAIVLELELAGRIQRYARGRVSLT